MVVRVAAGAFGGAGGARKKGRSDRAVRCRRSLQVVAMAVVVAVAAVAGDVGVAGAASPVATPGPSGDYASCNVSLVESAVAFTDSQTGIVSYATGFGAYWKGYSVSIYCNTAFPKYAGQEQAVDVWYGSIQRYQVSTAVVQCDSAYGGNGCNWSADGHVTAACGNSNTVGCGLIPGQVGCLSAAYFAAPAYTGLSAGDKSTVSPYACSSAGVHCDVQVLSGGWSGYGYTGNGAAQQCAASVSFAAGAALEPAENWGSQAVVLPTVLAPVVVCTVKVNVNTGQATFTGTVAAVSGGSVSGGWDFGDGTMSVALNVVHGYTASAMPAGGFSAVFTGTAIGDGTTHQGTASAVCTKVVDFSGSSSPAGGTATSGGTAPPTSCGWFDFICDLQVSAAWLFVPSATFYADWSGFEYSMKTAVPFSYVVDALSWSYTLQLDVTAELGGTPTCVTLYGRCVSIPGGYATVIRDMLTVIVVSSFALGVVAIGRRVVGEH